MMRRLAVLLLAFSGAPSAALAQSWELTHVDGSSLNLGPVAVMGEVSTIRFQVKNLGTTKLAHFEVQLKNAYDISGGTAPAGWVVTTITQGDRRIIYRAVTCSDALSAGGAGIFTANLVATAGRKDVRGEKFQSFAASAASNTAACSTTAMNPAPSRQVAWDLVSLSANLSVFPRTLSTSKSATVTLNVTNRSTAAYTVRAADPTSTLSFTKTSGPLPASLPLGPGQSGTMQWVFTPGATGPFTFSTWARDGTTPPEATSPTVTTPSGVVGNFTALADISPPLVTSGQTVRFTLSVTNTGGLGPLQQVTPTAPSFTGNASAVPVDPGRPGPTPAAVASLPVGSSASFYWDYTVTGALGARYSFSSSATAKTDGGLLSESDVASSAIGAIGSHSLTIAPAQIPDGTAGSTVGYTVQNGGSLNIRSVYLYPPNGTYLGVAPNKYPNVPAGWTAQDINGGYQWTATSTAAEITPGHSETFPILYARVGTGSMTANFTEQHRLQLTQADNTTVRIDAPMTVTYRRADVPDVTSLTVTSGPGRNTLAWNNPSDHDGVLILRGASPVSVVLVQGTEYEVGDSIGAATVIHSSARGDFTSSFTDDDGLTAQTRYHYKVFNHDASFYYSAGSAPGAAGIFGEPTDRSAGRYLWAYNSGSASAIQPIVERGVGVFSADNSGRILGNITNASDASSDGNERWRPIQFPSGVQGRFPVATLPGRTGRYLLVGEQSGNVYAVNASAGTVAWHANNGVPLGEGIQAPLNSDFLDGFEYLFAVTRNSSSPTNNAVWVLNARDGSKLWTFQPGNLDIVNGAMSVDNLTARGRRLYIAGHTNGGRQPTLRIYDYVGRTEVNPPVPFSYGDTDYAVAFDYSLVNGQFAAYTQAILTMNSGRVVGISLDTLQEVWSQNLTSTPKGFVMPTGGGFIATTTNGVERYLVSGSTVTQAWVAAIPGPTGFVVDYDAEPQVLYVSSTDGSVRKVNVATGAVGTPFPVTSGKALTPPRLDDMTRRLHVGSADGRVFAFGLPLP